MAGTTTTKTVTLTLDGTPATVPEGTLLIEAAKQAGIEIPSFCYYPGLSLQGACRMCLVEIEKMGKLQTACTTVVTNGMVVRTRTDQVANARKAMLEFLLTNHPLDCPVCDKGGECELQDAVFRYGAPETRFMEAKLHHEEQKFSNLVYYDWPRCILCYRCIRVCDEGMDVNALGIGFRGAHSEIIPNRGDHLECEECGACIDICPVGALTSGAYRYKTRPWELTYAGTVCNHCGDGCKTTLSIRNNQIVRANNRDHSGINGEFLCVKGRFGWDFVNSEKRLATPLVCRNLPPARLGPAQDGLTAGAPPGQPRALAQAGLPAEVLAQAGLPAEALAQAGGALEAGTWEEALGVTVDRLKEILGKHGPEAVAVIGSNRTTNEENYLLQRFARTVLGTNNLDHHRTADFPSLVRALSEARATDRTATMEEIFEASSVLLIGNDPTHQHPLVAYQIRQAVRQHGARLYVVNGAEVKLERRAALFVQVRPGGEPEAVRVLMGAEGAGRELSREARNELVQLRDRLQNESDTVIIFGDEVRGESVGDLVRWGMTLPGRTRFVALGDYANSRGASDMGLLPHTLAGYLPVADQASRAQYESAWGARISATPGRNIRDVLAGCSTGEIQALMVFGANPIRTFKLSRESLGKLGFLCVVDLFLTETAELADVVLPAASFAEKTGTVTNTCGQVQALKKSMRRPGTRSDFEILLMLGRLFGQDWPYLSPEDVLREIISRVPGYAIALPNLLVGRAVAVRPEGNPPGLERQDLVFSSRDSLFTSGTLGGFSVALNSVGEARQPYGHWF